jgi:hypothetical protein
MRAREVNRLNRPSSNDVHDDHATNGEELGAFFLFTYFY